MEAGFDATKLAAARLRAADAQPFLALALYALSPVVDHGRGTFAVDEQWRLYVDPEALDRWKVDECAGVLLHEVGHVLREHAARARTCGVGEDARDRWNLAADAEINDDLVADGVMLPGSPVTPRSLGAAPGKSSEHYYHLLSARPDLPIDALDCGSGCHGVVEPESRLHSHEAPSGLGAAEALLLRRQIALAVVHWHNSHPGTVGGGWTRWAESILNPQLDWRRLLDGEVRRAFAAIKGSVDYSYRRPSRRQLPGVVLPSMYRPLPAVGIIVDSSGSVSAEQLNAAWSEVRGCLRSVGARRELLQVYATDTTTRRIDRVDLPLVAIEGGGGTDLRDGFRCCLAGRPSPDLIVVLTDGLTPWPQRKPRCSVVVGLLEGGAVGEAPPWAKTVRIPATR